MKRGRDDTGAGSPVQGGRRGKRTVAVGEGLLSLDHEPTGRVHAAARASSSADALDARIAQRGLGAEPGGSRGGGGDGRHVVRVGSLRVFACVCVCTPERAVPRDETCEIFDKSTNAICIVTLSFGGDAQHGSGFFFFSLHFYFLLCFIFSACT